MKRATPLVNSGSSVAGLGTRIREIRGSLTQDEFSRHIGIPTRTLIRYEAGQTVPTVETMAVICYLFRIDPWWFLFDEESSFSLSVPPSSRVRGIGESKRDKYRVREAV